VDACSCVPLGLLVYNSHDAEKRIVIKSASPDYVGMVLFGCSVVPILVGLSLTSSKYSWVSWQAGFPLTLGSVSLLLFVVRESFPNVDLTSFRFTSTNHVRMLNIRKYKGSDATSVFLGAVLLGMVVRALA
jgi:hypothetical protein